MSECTEPRSGSGLVVDDLSSSPSMCNTLGLVPGISTPSKKENCPSYGIRVRKGKAVLNEAEEFSRCHIMQDTGDPSKDLGYYILIHTMQLHTIHRMQRIEEL